MLKAFLGPVWCSWCATGFRILTEGCSQSFTSSTKDLNSRRYSPWEEEEKLKCWGTTDGLESWPPGWGKHMILHAVSAHPLLLIFNCSTIDQDCHSEFSFYCSLSGVFSSLASCRETLWYLIFEEKGVIIMTPKLCSGGQSDHKAHSFISKTLHVVSSV